MRFTLVEIKKVIKEGKKQDELLDQFSNFLTYTFEAKKFLPDVIGEIKIKQNQDIPQEIRNFNQYFLKDKFPRLRDEFIERISQYFNFKFIELTEQILEEAKKIKEIRILKEKEQKIHHSLALFKTKETLAQIPERPSIIQVRKEAINVPKANLNISPQKPQFFISKLKNSELNQPEWGNADTFCTLKSRKCSSQALVSGRAQS